MRLLARTLREPLVHFLVIGAAVFAFYSLVTPGGDASPPRERIVVSEGRVAQIAEVFARTWQRPPTPEELHGLVDAYVKEEIFYREALKLGLDRDDAVVRRRMQQKMEFLAEPTAEALQPGVGELQAFLEANRELFRSEARIAFQQIFINPQEEEPPAALRAASLLEELRGSRSAAAAQEHGDPTLLPYEMRLAPLSVIARTFGEDFAAGLADQPDGAWSGPLASVYGLHLVRIVAREAAVDPPLAEVEPRVLREWQRQQRDAYAAEEYRRLRDSYEVVLPFAEGAGAPQR
jgi:hypothetical protein